MKIRSVIKKWVIPSNPIQSNPWMDLFHLHGLERLKPLTCDVFKLSCDGFSWTRTAIVLLPRLVGPTGWNLLGNYRSIQNSTSEPIFFQRRRNEFESGRAQVRAPPLFDFTTTISRFGARFRDGHYSLVRFLFAVLLLMVPPCPAICKSGGHVPSVSYGVGTTAHLAVGIIEGKQQLPGCYLHLNPTTDRVSLTLSISQLRAYGEKRPSQIWRLCSLQKIRKTRVFR